jgi:hypothetical protein
MKPNGGEKDKSCYYEKRADDTHVDAGGYIVDSGDSYCYIFNLVSGVFEMERWR